jgi:hypothetical protein
MHTAGGAMATEEKPQSQDDASKLEQQPSRQSIGGGPDSPGEEQERDYMDWLENQSPASRHHRRDRLLMQILLGLFSLAVFSLLLALIRHIRRH